MTYTRLLVSAPTLRDLTLAIGAVLVSVAACASAQTSKTATPPTTSTTASSVSDASMPATPVPNVKLPARANAVNDGKPSNARDATLRAQILLDRAHFSPGEIDGMSGSSSRRAISGFQARNGLAVTGALDVPTWEALDRDTQPALTNYTLTDADVAGPFVPLPSDMMEKAKLPALGYTSVQEALGEKFHMSPTLLKKLNPKASFTAGEEILVPDVASDAPLPKADKLVVDKSDSTVSLLDASGKTFAQFPATMGSEHDPLPIGDWKILGVAHNPTFHYNPALFWDANSKHSKAVIPAGPNNPVGVVWVDLSKPHYGIHGTPEPSKIGKTQSHGCIRLTNWDAMTLSQSVTSGMTAVLQE